MLLTECACVLAGSACLPGSRWRVRWRVGWGVNGVGMGQGWDRDGMGIGMGIGTEKERENHRTPRVCVLVLLPAVRRANREQPRSQLYPHLPALSCGAARVCARGNTAQI